MKPALPTSLPRLLVHPWIWRMAWRDSRRERQRLAVFAASIVVGIAALVSIHALRASLERGISLQARELLGSDLQISARLPFDEKARDAFAAASTAADYETNFTTMMTFPSGEARLVQLRLLGGQFPFYGKIATRPADAWPGLREQTAPVLFLEPALLDQFGVAIGDSVRLGEADLVISSTVLQTAPRTGRFAGFAPDVYANRAALDATGLLGRTSLAGYHAHLQLPDDAEPSRVAERLTALFPDVNWEIETADSRRDQIGEVLNRFEQFLSLIALFSLVLGAIGVASAMHAQIRRRRQSIAILRCLGLSSRGALAVYFVQAAVLGILATVAGALLGVALHAGIVAWFREDLPVALALLPPADIILRTASVGFLACLGFALLPLLQVRDIPPLAVLRDNSGGLGRLRLVLRALPVGLFLFALLTLLSILGSTSLQRGLVFPIGLAGVFLLLLLAGQLLIIAARRGAKASPGYLTRQGLANLFRPQNQTLLFVVSLGLGVCLLTLTVLARAQVLRQIAVTESGAGPNLYLVDVQPDQADDVRALLAERQLPVMESAPMVNMRLVSVNGTEVRQLRDEGRVPAWVLRREFRSSYRTTLNETEREIAGQWPPAAWNPDAPIPLSLETGMAEDLNVGLGDRLVVNIQGRTLEAEIVHLREVDWSRLNLNFFMLFPPGVLEDAPGFHVITTRLPEDTTSGRLQAAIAATFPNVSAIDLSLILETVRELLGRVGQAVQVLSAFTVVAGIFIMTGIFLNGREQRTHDAVLLRTLGASTRQLRTILCVEFGVLGFLAALTGSLLALGAHVLIARFVFSADPVFPLVSVAVILLGAAALSLLMGGLLSRGVCHAPPLSILRRE
jgi:putative ABC transport system permease protein